MWIRREISRRNRGDSWFSLKRKIYYGRFYWWISIWWRCSFEAFRDTSEEEANKFDFEFDDDDLESRQEEEDSLDLQTEMMESKIQRAAGIILIKSRQDNVSDIHIEPKEDRYKIRVRKDGVMQTSYPSRKTRYSVSCVP